MKMLISTALAAGLVALAAPATATTIKLTPDQINLGDTNTASFSDGSLTLTPLLGDTPTTFNGNAVRLGIDDTGTSNNNAFNDPDTDPINGNEEKLQFELAADAGLAQIEYDFSRADGPGENDGVIISGFLSDPSVTFSMDNEFLFGTYDEMTSTLRLNIPGGLFSAGLTAIDFDPAASLGQTLLMTVTDTTQAGAQFAVRSLSYTVVPEPTAAALLLLAAAPLARRSRL